MSEVGDRRQHYCELRHIFEVFCPMQTFSKKHLLLNVRTNGTYTYPIINLYPVPGPDVHNDLLLMFVSGLKFQQFGFIVDTLIVKIHN